ncbi:ArsR/SmtB family transcription factor [Lacticigenium naphthae]|uniref:ArsR/SmtB family transcription factor n=1 Tax=Lacticigenium naphthae TaxID=515351 RepID=UPI00041B312A|nr:metalloregulator ArsR/SmtB family transcription factor [Lacticigenium naphthae]
MNDTEIVTADNETIQCVSKFFKVISDPTRISILFLLKKKEHNVGEIATSLNMEQSAISHQLNTLKKYKLVKSRRNGKSIFYSLDDEHVFSILEQVINHTQETSKK